MSCSWKKLLAALFFIISALHVSNPALAAGKVSDTALVIYQEGYALVNEKRQVSLAEGEGSVVLSAVPSEIEPASVRIRKTGGAPWELLSQSFEHDLRDRQSLLEAFTGSEIQLLHWNDHHDRKDIVDAVLIANRDTPVYEIKGSLYADYPGIPVFPAEKKGFYPEPSLVWEYASSEAGQRKVMVSYLTGGLSWHADYALTLDRETQTGSLTSWVSLENRSGAGYRKARVGLLAGVVNRPPSGQKSQAMMARSMLTAESASGVRESGAFEYHNYEIGRPVTLDANERKQVVFLSRSDVAFDRRYRIEGQSHFFRQPSSGEDETVPVRVYVDFENTQESGMGIPLPAGNVKVYESHGPGDGEVFAGEDRIGHTPVDETVRLHAGYAFDIIARRKQVDFQRLSHSLHESEWRIRIHNHKDRDVTVEVLEPLQENWKVLKHSHPYETENARTLRFNVKVQAQQEVTLSYRVAVGL